VASATRMPCSRGRRAERASMPGLEGGEVEAWGQPEPAKLNRGRTVASCCTKLGKGCRGVAVGVNVDCARNGATLGPEVPPSADADADHDASSKAETDPGHPRSVPAPR
jgi:hypothetical protein